MWKWLRRIGLGLLALVVLAVAGGAAFEALSRSGARRDFPPPGRLVDIGGRKLQLDCRGSGGPTVVFEAGLDTLGSLSWSAVQDAVARTTRACAYSRAGLMWSDPAGRPFSAVHLADDLHAALAAAGEKAPYVMVGHSMGGPYLTTYTGRYGADVAGLVFVDASHPDQIGRMRAAVGRDLDQSEALAKTADALTWTGAIRLILPADMVAPTTAPARTRAAGVAFFPASLHGLVGEAGGLTETLAAATRARKGSPTPFGDRPLVVLTHANLAPPEEMKALKLTPAENARLEATWLAMQREQAAWSTRGRQRVVAGATHYIQFDKPHAVVEAVNEVVAQVRADAAAKAIPPAAE